MQPAPAAEIIYREADEETPALTPTATLTLGAAMTSLLAAPEVDYALAVASSEPDAASETVQALRSIEAHLTGGTSVWTLLEPLIDQCIGKKRGGHRHSRAASVVGWLLAHDELGTATADASS